MKNIKFYLFCLLSITLAPTHAQKDIGKFLTAELTNVVNNLNQSREVVRKDSVGLHETIQTQDDDEAVAELWTIDDSRFSLDPNSSLTFTELDVSESGCTGMKATLAYGKFRGSSGKCSGKTEIKTHIASAYAWGTDYEIVYIPKGKIIAGYEKLKPGLYEKVNEGKVLVKNDAGSLMVGPGEVGYVGSSDIAPVIIPMPDFFTVANRNTGKPKSKPKPKPKPKPSKTPSTTKKPKTSSTTNQAQTPLVTEEIYEPIAEDPAVVEETIVEIPVVEVVATTEEVNEVEVFDLSPEILNTSVTTNEDESVYFRLIDDSATTINSLSSNQGNTLIESDGYIIFYPVSNFNGVATINYTITNGTSTTTSSLEVVVIAINDQTTVANSTGNVNEDAELNIDLTANATDIDGDTLTITSASAANGQIVNGVYTPDANFNGTDTITYVINDSDEATLTVTVDAVNDQTTVTNSTATIDEDDGLFVDLTANATDIDGDTLTITSASAENGTIDNGTYYPDTDFNGTDTITYVINDSDSATVTVTVNPINDAPYLEYGQYDSSVLEGSTSGNLVQAVATDVDANSTITYSLSGTGVENFTIDPTTGQISVVSSASIDYESDYDPVDRIEPVYSLTITATDEYNAFDTVDLWIDVDDLRGDLTPSFINLWFSDNENNDNVGTLVVGPFTTNGTAPDTTADSIFTDGVITKINYYDSASNLIAYSLKVADTYDRSGEYELANSTVYWDFWNKSTFTEIENGVTTTLPEPSLTILEDNPNDLLSLPTVGVLNYDVVDASPVMYGVCITCNDAVTYGYLNSADLYINFYSNNIGAQFTVESPTGVITTSDFITATLIQQTGQFFGQTGLMNFVEFVADNNTLEYESIDNGLGDGDAFMQGTMMGNSGSHVGVVYGVSDAAGNLGIGAVLFAAIENINLNITEVSSEGYLTQNSGSSILTRNISDIGDLDFDYAKDQTTDALISLGGTDSDGSIWDMQAYDVATSQIGVDGVDDHGSYSTSSNTTIDWGIWSAALDTSYNADGSIASTDILDGQIHIFEDRRDTLTDMSLPTTGTINYDIADQSVVVIKDTVTGDWLSNGTLDSADMNINFATNAVDTQFVITDDTNTQITSDLITGMLDPTSGLIIGQSGGFNYAGDDGIEWEHTPNPALSQGDGAFIGNMMGDNGSHAGIVYQVELGNDSKIGSGVVIFEAQ